ncbi:MAG: hypothetical protein HC892_01615 [Saprospiraceae bacterium]|nr:hypothetical protein [Saprospiraceae bacterium]
MKMDGFLLTIAHRSPKKAIGVLHHSGYAKIPNSPKELYSMLDDYVNKNGKDGISELTKIHPDARLIIDSYEKFKASKPININVKEESKVPTKSSANGEYENCGGCTAAALGVAALASDGSKSVMYADGDKKSLTQTLIISGAIMTSMLLLALIVSNATSAKRA